MTTPAYLRYPHLHGDLLTFVAEDDVWVAPVSGGRAWRVSSFGLPAANPRFSDDGSRITWTVVRAQKREVVSAKVDGGDFRQLTHFGHASTLNKGYLPDGRVLVTSSTEQGDSRLKHGYAVDPVNGRAEALNYGPMESLSFGPVNGDERPAVLGTLLSREPGWWKRYRGGTAGKLWIDRDGGGDFSRLVPELDGNLADPMWIGERIYFLSDHEGHGNLYSVRPDGTDLRRHTDHEDFYVRHAATDGKRIVFESAGRLFLLSEPTQEAAPVQVEIQVGGTGRIDTVHQAGSSAQLVPSADGETVLVLAEGTLHLLGVDGGPAREIVAEQGSRLRLPQFVGAERLAYTVDRDGEEQVVVVPLLAGAAARAANAVEPAPVTAAAAAKTATAETAAAEPTGKTESPAAAAELPSPVSASAVLGRAVKPGESRQGGSDEHSLTSAEHDSTDEQNTTDEQDSTDEKGPAPAQEQGVWPESEVLLQLPTRNRVVSLKASPDGTRLLLGTAFGEVLLADTRSGEVEVVADERLGAVTALTFSPDSAYFAWIQPSTGADQGTRILLRATAPASAIAELTDARFADLDLCFTRDGKYLAFLSARSFDPVYSRQGFDLGFPVSTKLFLVALAKDSLAPFAAKGLDALAARTSPATTSSSTAPGGKDVDAARANAIPGTRVDLEGIDQRIITVPLAAGNYEKLQAGVDALLLLEPQSLGSLGDGAARVEDEPAQPKLISVELATGKRTVLREDVSDFALSGDGKSVVIRSKDKATRIDPSQGEKDDKDQNFDLESVSFSVNWPSRWRQQLREAWRLQRDFFWDEGLSSIDWDEIYERYAPLTGQVASQDDLADLLWEVHGELGTSHAYVQYQPAPEKKAKAQGLLGADLDYDGQHWIISRILHGDSSDPRAGSPLRAAGVLASAGDRILAIDGRPVGGGLGESPQALLAGKAGRRVELSLASTQADGGTQPRRVVVVPLADQERLRYQDWVQTNRRLVHEASQGAYGYLHVPDMGPHGWAQLHRDLAVESAREALVVDVRRNRGGHTSQLVAELLGRQITAWGFARGHGDFTYPNSAPRGPIVFLTDEFAGSDGDIITQVARMRQLGPVVGVRTWGGVIGIDSEFDLVDGTTVTQPRYAHWFVDGTGLGVENYGVDPDIEVPFPPHAHRAGTDPQLERGIGVLKEMLREIPTKRAPENWLRPDLRAPRLGPRPQSR